jgi:UDP-glucose 4-epimerase
LILITGGAGYIGSHTNKILSEKGYKTVVFDNLERGNIRLVKWGEFVKGDLRNIEDIRKTFKKYKFKAVIHFAAYAYVGESVEFPDKYYENNVLGTLNLLKVMKEFGVNNIIFSSSCATYGIPKKIPISETTPQNPINPYGKSKLFSENIIKDFEQSYSIKHIILRYFNAAGADVEGEIGEIHDPETHLIPLTIRSALNDNYQLKIFGSDYPTYDGTCIRDYIHVLDLAEAHFKGLEYLIEKEKSNIFNVGIGTGFSILDIIKTVNIVSKKKINYQFVDRRHGDPPTLIASNDKIKRILKWQPHFTNIEDIIKSAYNWHLKFYQIH